MQNKRHEMFQRFITFLNQCRKKASADVSDITKAEKQEKQEKQERFEKAMVKNPYLQSRALWNELYGELQTKLENSYRIIFILSLVIAIAFVGFVIVAGETKVKPVPFIIHGNEVITLADNSSSLPSMKANLAIFFVKKFIRDARSVSADQVVNDKQKIAALSMVGDAATSILKTYYEKNDPNTIAQTSIKNLKITSVLQESSNTLDVRWVEEWLNVQSGELTRQAHYIAQITYQFGKPSQNETILDNNPLGVEITHLSWSLDENG